MSIRLWIYRAKKLELWTPSPRCMFLWVLACPMDWVPVGWSALGVVLWGIFWFNFIQRGSGSHNSVMWSCTQIVGQLLEHAGDLRSLYPWSTCIKVPEGTKISHCVLLVTFLKKERWLLLCVWKSLWHHLLARWSVTIRILVELAEGSVVLFQWYHLYYSPSVSPQLQYQVFSSTWSEPVILGLIPSEDKHQNSCGAKAVIYKESDMTDPQVIYVNVYALPIAKLWGFISAGDLAHISKLFLNNVALITRVYVTIFTCMR